jgi:hypothetical protein
MSTGVKVGLALVGIALMAFVWMGLSANRSSDQQLIEQALNDSIAASKAGRPGSVLELLSQNFKVNDEEYGSRSQIAKAIRDYRPDIKLQSTAAQVEGHSAEINSNIDLSLSGPLPLSLTIPNAKLQFEKELGTKWLLFPDRRWKLVRVTIPEESMQSLPQ